MKHKYAHCFKRITHAVLESDSEGGEPIAIYDEGSLRSFVSEAPRLVATYKLVSVRLLQKRSVIKVIKSRSKK